MSFEKKIAGNTFLNSAGQPCSEIDYFLYSKSSNRNFSRKYIMDDLAVDVSDHYPISIVCDTDCEQRIDTDSKDGKSKINWEKVDKECYSEMVNQEITNRKVMEEVQKLESNYGIENMIIEISNILRDSAKKMYTSKKSKEETMKTSSMESFIVGLGTVQTLKTN